MIKRFIYNNIYGLSIFIIIMLYILTYVTPTVDNYVYYSYVEDYSFGFGARRFIGSLVDILSGGYLNKNFVWVFILCAFVIGAAVFSFILNNVIKKIKKLNQSALFVSLLLLLVYFLGPASIAYLFRFPNNGRLDLYLLIIDLLIFILFVNRKSLRNVYYILLLVLMTAGILIHQLYACSYLPVVVALMVYDCVNSTNAKKKVLIYSGILFFLFLLFIKLNFFSTSSIGIDEKMQLLSSKSDLPIYKPAVYYDSYGTLAIHLKDWILPNMKHLVLGFVLEMILLSPIFYFFYIIWMSINDCITDTKKKQIYKIIPFVFFLMVPAFFVIVDYARLFGAYIFSQISLFILLIYEEDEYTLKACSVLSDRASKEITIIALFLIYISAITLFHSIEFSPAVENILRLLHIKFYCA